MSFLLTTFDPQRAAQVILAFEQHAAQGTWALNAQELVCRGVCHRQLWVEPTDETVGDFDRMLLPDFVQDREELFGERLGELLRTWRVESGQQGIDLGIRVSARSQDHIKDLALVPWEGTGYAEVRRCTGQRVIALLFFFQLLLRHCLTGCERTQRGPANIGIRGVVKHCTQALVGVLRAVTERRDGRAREQQVGIGTFFCVLQQLPNVVGKVG